jgi:hypothetical protein
MTLAIYIPPFVAIAVRPRVQRRHLESARYGLLVVLEKRDADAETDWTGRIRNDGPVPIVW